MGYAMSYGSDPLGYKSNGIAFYVGAVGGPTVVALYADTTVGCTGGAPHMSGWTAIVFRHDGHYRSIQCLQHRFRIIGDDLLPRTNDGDFLLGYAEHGERDECGRLRKRIELRRIGCWFSTWQFFIYELPYISSSEYQQRRNFVH